MTPMPPLSTNLETARRLDREGQREAALGAYRTHLEAHPASLEGWLECGGLLLVMGRFDESRRACEAALNLAPDDYGALVQSASALMRLGRLEEAGRQFDRALAQDPRRLAGRLMYSDCLVLQGELEGARSLLEGILAEEPGLAVALDRRNTLLARLEDWGELRKDMRRQLARYSGPEAEYVESHLDLLFGDMAQGWWRFEARLDLPGRKPLRNFLQPRWDGTPFPGKRILLTWEQGFGDTLMFLRFAPLVKALGGEVLAEVQPPLLDVAATCPGLDAVFPHGAPLPPFDFQASLLSLPYLLGTRLESIPAEVPYLGVPALVANQASLADRLEQSSGMARIGICWAGNTAHPKDAKRSLTPSVLMPLLEVPGVAWHSFQRESDLVGPFPENLALGSLLSTFSDTAFALAAMDLLITVDTAVAHLAGALGIPTLLLLPFIPDWRWMLGQSDSPWYPTLRLYRQPSPGDWPSVGDQVVQDLLGSDEPVAD